MGQEGLSLLAFHKRSKAEKLGRTIPLTCVGLKVIGALAVSTTKFTFKGNGPFAINLR
jgi:hypothetical protein